MTKLRHIEMAEIAAGIICSFCGRHWKEGDLDGILLSATSNGDPVGICEPCARLFVKDCDEGNAGVVK